MNNYNTSNYNTLHDTFEIKNGNIKIFIRVDNVTVFEIHEWDSNTDSGFIVLDKIHTMTFTNKDDYDRAIRIINKVTLGVPF